MKLAAPQANGAMLAEPGFAALPGLVLVNRKRLDAKFPDLRRLARDELQTDHPVIITGHQPEHFHPGVWVKNFAPRGLAERVGGLSVNLIADSDTMRHAVIMSPAGPLHFDEHRGELPYEIRPVYDETLFDSFPERLREASRSWPFEPVGLTAWRHHRGSIAERFVAMRRSLEREWGCDNLELKMSDQCLRPSFQAFAEQIVNDRHRFRDVYNLAIRTYRRRHKLRSRNHPAPELEENELPFWTMNAGRRGRTFEVRDRSALRPKALLLTLYARLILGDFFIHGLGGGKYDEVTDDIIRTYFDIEPPAFQILTATLRFPFPGDRQVRERLRDAKQQLRHALWVPQRLTQNWAEHEAVRRLPMTMHAERMERFHQFRGLLARERKKTAVLLEEMRLHVKSLDVAMQAQATLDRRDYAWVLHPASTLRPLMERTLIASRTGTG